MKKLSSISILITLAFSAYAQEFDIRKVELTTDRIILHYDLLDTTKGHVYTIRLYSSRDSYSAPLKKVSGDVGLEITPGLNKKLTWSSREELGPTFAGDIDLEIRGRIYIPFLRFEGFENIRTIRRGDPRTITWTGGSRQNVLNFDLYKGDNLVWTRSGVANDPHVLELVIPTNVKPGSGYYFRVSDSKNKDQEVRTPSFSIKRKYSLGLKAGVIAVVGSIVYLLIPKPEPDVEGPPATPNEPN